MEHKCGSQLQSVATLPAFAAAAADLQQTLTELKRAVPATIKADDQQPPLPQFLEAVERLTVHTLVGVQALAKVAELSTSEEEQQEPEASAAAEPQVVQGHQVVLAALSQLKLTEITQAFEPALRSLAALVDAGAEAGLVSAAAQLLLRARTLVDGFLQHIRALLTAVLAFHKSVRST